MEDARNCEREFQKQIGTILIWFVDYIQPDQSYSLVELSNPDFGKFQTLPFQCRCRASKKNIRNISPSMMKDNVRTHFLR